MPAVVFSQGQASDDWLVPYLSGDNVRFEDDEVLDAVHTVLGVRWGTRCSQLATPEAEHTGRSGPAAQSRAATWRALDKTLITTCFPRRQTTQLKPLPT